MPFWWAKAQKKAIHFQSDESKAGLKPGRSSGDAANRPNPPCGLLAARRII
jgi:hypothetical protein